MHTSEKVAACFSPWVYRCDVPRLRGNNRTTPCRPAKLGKILLKAVSSKEEYMKYHEWRSTGFGPKYKAYFETQVR
jgi:hypothetical protein